VRIVVTRSLACDYIINSPGDCKEHILEEKGHAPTVSFLVGSMQRMREGLRGTSHTRRRVVVDSGEVSPEGIGFSADELVVIPPPDPEDAYLAGPVFGIARLPPGGRRTRGGASGAYTVEHGGPHDHRYTPADFAERYVGAFGHPRRKRRLPDT